MRLIDADAMIEKHPQIVSMSMKFNLDLAPTIDAVSVQHEGRTSIINVKDIDEWKGRIILDEGVKTKRCAVYYADADEPVVRCKDCRFNYGLSHGEEWSKDDIVCEYHMSDGFRSDDFCSRGVRMDGDAHG